MDPTSGVEVGGVAVREHDQFATRIAGGGERVGEDELRRGIAWIRLDRVEQALEYRHDRPRTV